MKQPVVGDMVVVENGSGGDLAFATLGVGEDGALQLGFDPEDGVPFVPMPDEFEEVDGILLGFAEGLAIKEIVPEGAMELLGQYSELCELISEAEEFEPSDVEYDTVEAMNEDVANRVAALTYFNEDEMGGTTRAVALFMAIGLPVPDDREKLILLGVAFDYLDARLREFTEAEDDGGVTVSFTIPMAVVDSPELLPKLMDDIEALIEAANGDAHSVVSEGVEVSVAESDDSETAEVVEDDAASADA